MRATYTYTTIDPPSSTYTISIGPSSINDKEQIVGEYQDNGTTHGFLDNHGVYTTIDPPGSIETIAYGYGGTAGRLSQSYRPQHRPIGKGLRDREHSDSNAPVRECP
jgi:hypothetical protein